jgi:DAK2 domain fusion protein YloV
MLALTVSKLKEMIDAGAKAVSAEYEYINELNVFPVPDGDTGTNMMITINGAFDSIKNIDFSDIQLLGKQFSRGLLMNARGNSGVIFSQIIKGFTANFKSGKGEIGMLDFIEAFTNAKNTAYNAVATPIEGTILTVIRVTAEQLNKHKHFKSIEDIMELASKEARIVLSKTPQMLKELKEVGVVDSGGYGLCCFFDGMLNALKEQKNKNKSKEVTSKTKIEKIVARKSFIDSYDDNNVGFGYCCEFILSLQTRVSLKQPHKHKFDLGYFKKELSKIGDSSAVIVDDGIVKLHIHSL